MNKEEIIKKPFYLIAKYWLGELQGFIKIGDNEEEITKLFEDKYMSTKEHDFGVTEESYSLLKVSATELLDDLDEQSLYCEVCGHCGEIGCCGIETFIQNHILGKTNCKNEHEIICDLRNLCEYKDDVFKENKQLKIQVSSREEVANKYKEVIDKLKEWIYIVQQNKDNKHFEPIISTDELDELLDILKEVE